MIIRLINKKAVLICAALSLVCGLFIFLTRYSFYYSDPMCNNFLYIHDSDLTSVDLNLMLSITNILLMFPFAAELLTYNKSTNEIYIVSRMADSARFYFIKFSQLALLCLIESAVYNATVLIAYCVFGAPAESGGKLAGIFLYTVAVNFLVGLAFSAVLQLMETLADAKAALILIIIVFCLFVFLGFQLPEDLAGYWITNFYFITPTFGNESAVPPPFEISVPAAVLIPAGITAAITVTGSMIYKHKDHI